MAEAADQIIPQMTLVDWLDDLTVRFLLNLPPSELSSVPRLCFQVEEAQWFYEDFIRPANPALPSLNLRQFCLTLFQHCPLLSGFNAAQHLAAYEEFLAYKVRVPVRGAILMDDNMEKVLLVRGWKKGASWSFPRGKINKDEPDIDCAIREVYEETGFDLGAAGLVERNKIGDGKVKAIDVTMREQHMKLFVFRGVALDTHFETKTRKEIGKIQWYNVKDLPGFKKVKGVAGQGQGEAESVKFYMVAPFLGHLKKWIGQQRRKDSEMATQAQHGRNISLSNEGIQATITEDEAEDTEAGLFTNNGAPSGTRSADELKRLLSIGGPASSTSQPLQPVLPSNGAPTNTLLAMLQGSIVAPAGSSLPHTPYEQVDPFIPAQEPRTPQPQPPRHASAATPQSVLPQSQYSPQTLQQGLLQQQQAQRHSSMFNPSFSSQLSHQQPGLNQFPPHIQQQLLQQQQRQHSLPAGLLPGQGPGPHLGQRLYNPGLQQAQHGSSVQDIHVRGQSQQQLLPPHSQPIPNQNMYNVSTLPPQRHMSGFGPAAAHAPIGSERAAPDANKLPPPKLNAHSMKLLDAFKTGPGTSVSGPSGNGNGQRSGSQHQAALLDLFRKPSVATPSPLSSLSAQKPVSPASASSALTDATEMPAPARNFERRPTLNEITRTLPPRTKAVSPAMPAMPAELPQAPPSNVLVPDEEQPPQRSRTPGARSSVRVASETLHGPRSNDVQIERPKSRGQLFDPSHPKRTMRASPQVKQQEVASSRPQSQLMGRAPKSPRPGPRPPASSSPKPRNKQARNENGPPRQPQPVPQFSILQRPGSSRTSVPPSPLRQEAPSSARPLQVLKRQPDNQKENPNVALLSNNAVGTPAADDKKDQLLALFGKRTQSSAAPVPTQAQNTTSKISSAPTEPQQDRQQKNPLLDLLQGSQAEKAPKTPEPPASPDLIPQRKPSAQGSGSQHLLNLFTKPSTALGNRLNSPGTPISPFTLGTPATTLSMDKMSHAAYEAMPRASENKSRLGSIASGMSNGTRSGSGAQTPTEAKDLLLGYLNGVVQSEGYKGTKKSV